jgi:hypothetical protein
VQLNAQRAAKEAAGHIRWLRPDYQQPSSALSNSELPVHHSIGLKADLALETASEQPLAASATASSATAVNAATAAPQAWPADLPTQVRAVSQVLTTATSPLTLSDIEAHFKGRGPWKNSLPRILTTL